VRRRRGRQRARLAHAHRAAVPGARRAPVHGQRARQARPSPHLWCVHVQSIWAHGPPA
jgi:hypothetical protein